MTNEKPKLTEEPGDSPRSSRPTGSALLRQLQNHRAMMAPHQRERHAGKLLIEATEEIQRLIAICQHVHDRLLRGDDDMSLLQKLQEGWKGPNVEPRHPAKDL